MGPGDALNLKLCRILALLASAPAIAGPPASEEWGARVADLKNAEGILGCFRVHGASYLYYEDFGLPWGLFCL